MKKTNVKGPKSGAPSKSRAFSLAAILVGASGCLGFDPGDLPPVGFPAPPSSPPAGPRLAFEHEVFEIDQGVSTEITSGCDLVPSSPDQGGFGFGLGKAPSEGTISYSVEFSFEANQVTSRVRNVDAGETVLEVEYDEEFLRSGGENESLAELSPDLAVLVIGRGVPSCEPRPEPPFVP